jgi:hypothetical protein
MVLDGSTILSQQVESIPFGTKRQRQILFAAQSAGDQKGGLREMKRLARINADLIHDHGGKPAYDLAAQQGTMAPKELPPSDAGLDIRKPGDQFVFGAFAWRNRH